jgi:hypothetical protein
LLVAGYAPLHSEQAIDAPDMAAAKTAIEMILHGHSPFPALAVDRQWNLVICNDAVLALLEGTDPALLAPPANVLRVSLHPNGLASRIVNLAEWRHHLLTRLRDDADRSADPALLALYEELRALPAPASPRPYGSPQKIAVPLQIRNPTNGAVLSFISTTTVFGTAVDVTLAELTLECFYPADEETRRTLMG